jgi:diguanylate cyclase (GGDEF)-like protein
MNVTLYINTLIGPCLVFILIAMDFWGKRGADRERYLLFWAILISSFAASVLDFCNRVTDGVPGLEWFTNTTVTLFYIVQNISSYLMVIFIDYIAHEDINRAKVLSIPMAFIFGFSVLLTLTNLHWHFYYYIAEGNIFIRGPWYPLRLLMTYLAMFFVLVDTFLSRKYILKSQVMLLVFFILLNVLGSALDLLIPSSGMTWPCFTAGLLYVYLFIVQSDSKIDSLTGLGNRLSFNEFMDNLARGRQSWHVVMLDLDHFKSINDTWGHAQGDNALRDMASVIKGCIRRTDFAARYGGDEFVIAIRAENNIDRLLSRFEEAMQRQNEKITDSNGRPYTLKASYGKGLFNGSSDESVHDFMARIDALMYSCKNEHYQTETAK